MYTGQFSIGHDSNTIRIDLRDFPEAVLTYIRISGGSHQGREVIHETIPNDSMTCEHLNSMFFYVYFGCLHLFYTI